MARIEFVVATNAANGVTRVVSSLASQLSHRDHDVVVHVAVVPNARLRRLVPPWGPGPVRGLFGWIRLIGGAVRREIRRGFRWVAETTGRVVVRRYWMRPRAPERGAWLVLANNWYQAFDVDRSRGRVVQLIHHYEEHADSRVRTLVHEAYAIDAVRIAMCEGTKAELTARGIEVDTTMFLGVDTNVFHADDRPRSGIVLYWGHEPRKGAAVGLDAVRRVVGSHDVRVTIASPLPISSPDPRFRVVADVSDEALAELLRGSSVFVYPSLMEGFGLPPLEAMACGCAVASTRVGAVPEYITDGADGLLVDPGDAAGLAAAVSRLLSDDRFARSLGDAAARAAATHTWARTADAFETALGLAHEARA